MNLIDTVILGAIAGFTIFLGLPIARLKTPRPAWQAFLSAVATGILLFLLWDILSKAKEPIDTALGVAHEGGPAPPGCAPVVGLPRPGRLDRWRPDIPGHDAGLQHAINAYICAVPGHRGGLDPVCGRRVASRRPTVPGTGSGRLGRVAWLRRGVRDRSLADLGRRLTLIDPDYTCQGS